MNIKKPRINFRVVTDAKYITQKSMTSTSCVDLKPIRMADKVKYNAEINAMMMISFVLSFLFPVLSTLLL